MADAGLRAKSMTAGNKVLNVILECDFIMNQPRCISN